MDKVFVTLKNGYAQIVDEKGYSHGHHLPNSDWVNVQVNGDTIMATNKSGYTQFFDKYGNYRGHM